MTLIVVLLQILVFKAAFNMNFYSRLLFAVTTESATACSWAWDWLQDSGQQGQKLPLLMATELRPEGQRRHKGLGEKKNVIRHFKESPVKGKATWRCQYRCNFSCLSHHSLSVPSIPVHPSMGPTALNPCCDCTP